MELDDEELKATRILNGADKKVYCKTISCPYRFNCARFLYNAKFELDETFIEIKEYEHTNTNCDYFIKKGN